MSFTWSGGTGNIYRFDMTTPGHFRYRTQMAWVTFNNNSNSQDIWYANNNGVDSQWVEVGLNSSNVLRVNNAAEEITTITPATSKWYHITLVINLNQWHFYIDGKLASTLRNTSTITAIDCAAVGGVPNGQFSLSWGGKIGVYKCWQRPLSSEEVRREMLCVYPASKHMLLGAWSFHQITAPYGKLWLGSLTLGAGTPVQNDSPYIPTFFIPRQRYSAPSGGGTTQTQTVAGTLSPVGVVVRLTGKTTVGISTPVGGLSKQTAKNVSGVVNPTAVSVKSIQKILSGAVTGTGSVTRIGQKVFVGVVSLVGSVSRFVSVVKSGEVTPTGVVVKAAYKAVSGGQSLVGVVTTIAVKVATFAGAFSPAGSINRLTQSIKGGSVTPTGIATKTVSVTVQGVVTSIGSVIKESRKVIVGVFTPTGSLATVAVKVIILVGQITPVGVVVKSVQKVSSGQIIPTGTVRNVCGKVLSGAVSISGNITKLVSKSVSGVITPVGTLTAGRIVRVLLTGAIGLAGSVVNVFVAGGGVVAKTIMYPWVRRRRRN